MIRSILTRLSICWPHRWSKWHQYSNYPDGLRQQRRCGRCYKVQDELVDVYAQPVKWREEEATNGTN